MNVVSWRVYLDSLEEALTSIVKVPDPPLYVQYTPRLFNDWQRWAIRYEEPEEGGKIRPFGERIGPNWMRWPEDFKRLEDFYWYYKGLVEEKENA